MGRRGPAKTPLKTLKARGSWRANLPERQNAVPAAVRKKVPPVPKFFAFTPREDENAQPSVEEIAATIWTVTAENLVEMGVLAESDLMALMRYCKYFALWIVCHDPELCLKIEVSLSRMDRKFGLTPGDRESVKAIVMGGGEKKADKDASPYFGNLKLSQG